MKTKRTFATTILSVLFLSALAGGALADPNCTCRYQGEDVLEGQKACLKTPQGMKMAKCEKVLNNTSWKFLEEPCPLAFWQQEFLPNASPFDTAQLRDFAE